MKNTPFLLYLSIFWFAACQRPATEPPTPTVLKPDPDPVAFDAPFTGVPATRDIAMYEVNMRAFSQAGTFKGVQDRLDSIKALGINVIWLMPIHPIGVLNSAGQLGSPYAVRNYMEVNPEFGTLADLQNLVKEAHNRNMAVIIDWVANHTSWDNPWISAHRAWYSKDASGQIIIPPGTNWADVADLDYNNAVMRTFMISAMKYWVLKANIDGFRCDYADGVPADFWKQAIDSLKTLPGRKYILLAEGNLSAQFSAGFELNYGWEFYGQTLNVYKNNMAVSGLLNAHNTEYSALPPGAAKLRFITNHDESAWNDSPVVLFNSKAGSLSAFVLTAFMGGVPLIYNGQEVGRADKTPFFSKSPIDWSQNPDVLSAYKRIMAFRQSSPAVREGALEMIADNAHVVAFKRTFQSEVIVVIVNTQNNAHNYSLPPSLANSSWKNALDNTDFTFSTAINLQPYQYLVLKQ